MLFFGTKSHYTILSTTFKVDAEMSKIFTDFSREKSQKNSAHWLQWARNDWYCRFSPKLVMFLQGALRRGQRLKDPVHILYICDQHRHTMLLCVAQNHLHGASIKWPRDPMETASNNKSWDWWFKSYAKFKIQIYPVLNFYWPCLETGRLHFQVVLKISFRLWFNYAYRIKVLYQSL